MVRGAAEGAGDSAVSRNFGRRQVFAAAAAAGSAVFPGAQNAAAQGRITQPPQRDAKSFMERAFDMRGRALAAGDQGFGAVVVRGGEIIGEGPSAVVTKTDPTAHAEIEAIRDAARRAGSRDLAGAILYSTFRPCPMCEAAASWAGIERMVHGAELADSGSPRLRRC